MASGAGLPWSPGAAGGIITSQGFMRPAKGLRFDFQGMNLVLPPDALPPGKFPYAQNVRAFLQEQVISRLPQGPALATIPGGGGGGGGGSLPDASNIVHSLRRLNNTGPNGPVSGYALISGAGQSLYRDSSLAVSGLSGKRLSMVHFRPDASPEPWMYIADSLKMVKVNSAGTVFGMGIPEPQFAPTARIASTQFASVAVFETETWNPFGTGGAVNAAATRTTENVNAILYDYGSSGMASVVPVAVADVSINQVLFNNDVNPLSMLVESVPAVPGNAIIATIVYDSGTTGLCTITTTLLVSAPQDSVYAFANEYGVVISSSPGPGAAATTIRMKTGKTHVVGEAFAGVASFRANIPPVAANWPIVTDASRQQTITVGTGGMIMTANVPFGGTMLGRIPQATDKLRFLVQVDVPANITNCTITLNLDPDYKDFTHNALSWTIVGGSFTAGGVWLDLSVLVSALVRVGTNTDLTLATGVNAIKISWVTTGSVIAKHDSLQLQGTYGTTADATTPPAQWRYRLRSSKTGAKSNPGPAMRTGLTPTAQAVIITPGVADSTGFDGQADTIDYYRFGGALLDWTYIGSTQIIAGAIQPFTDFLDDATAVANEVLEFDNFEPFPSIDLPRSGIVHTGVLLQGQPAPYKITWVSGDPFNTRWAPGTLITIGNVTYNLYKRPSSANQLELLQDPGVQFNVPYRITVPTLLDQALPAIWGPTDNAGYFFAVGDPLRPGTLYFTKGNNPDSAPDTNQMEITSPSEILMNGCLVDGLGMVFSTERAWFIYPRFARALASVIGTIGSPFDLIPAIMDRGLFCKEGLCTDGGGTVFFIAKDSIRKSAGGGASKSMSDDIACLFPHEGETPVNVSLGNTTYGVNCPDFTQPDGMVLRFADGYIYFDYLDKLGIRWTLTCEVATEAWCVDLYSSPVSIHAANEGQAVGVLTGCTDGTIKALDSSGTESFQQAIIATPSVGSGDTRALSKFGDIYLEATVNALATLIAYLAWDRYSLSSNSSLTPGSISPGATPAVRSGTVLEITVSGTANGLEAHDIGVILFWPLDRLTTVQLWQPSLVPLVEVVQGRIGEWDDGGTPGAKFMQGLIMDADTGGGVKKFTIESGDDNSRHALIEAVNGAVFNGRQKRAFSFSPPFVAHSMRFRPEDALPIKVWGIQYVFESFPELVQQWQTEGTSHGIPGWQHVREINLPIIATAPLTLTLLLDGTRPILIPIQDTAGVQQKRLVTIPYNKFKIIAYGLSSSSPFRVWAEDVEVKVGMWGRGGDQPYLIVKPFGGPGKAGAVI